VAQPARGLDRRLAAAWIDAAPGRLPLVAALHLRLT
jgi:hypothetical protein